MKKLKTIPSFTLPSSLSRRVGEPSYLAGVFIMKKTKEIWRDIKGYKGLYQISNFGRVKSLAKKWKAGYGNLVTRTKPDTIMKPATDEWGYLKESFSKNRNKRTIRVHVLVWDHFGNKRRNGLKLQIDHADNNKTNNHIENLQLLTSRQHNHKTAIESPRNGKRISKYVGVYYDKSRKRHRAHIIVNRKYIHIGQFKTEEEAHVAHKNYMIKHKIK